MTLQGMQKAKVDKIDFLLASIERDVMKEYRFGREKTLEVVKDLYSKYLIGVDKADYYRTLALYERLKKAEQGIKAIYTVVGKESAKRIINGQYQIFDESFLMDRYTMAFFSDKLEVDIKYAPPNPLVRDVAVTGDASRLVEIKNRRLQKIAKGMMPPSGDTLQGLMLKNTNDGLSKVLRTVKQGLINGESYAKQVNRVKDVFDGNVSNAARVIRTEGNRNLNAGAYLNSEELKEEGVRIRRQWVATLDGSTRDSHQHLDGQFEDDNGLFWIDGDSARYPCDFSDPANSINCRCTVIDVVQGLEPTLRRGVNPVTGKSDIASYRDYETWKKRGLN